MVDRTHWIRRLWINGIRKVHRQPSIGDRQTTVCIIPIMIPLVPDIQCIMYGNVADIAVASMNMNTPQEVAPQVEIQGITGKNASVFTMKNEE